MATITFHKDAKITVVHKLDNAESDKWNFDDEIIHMDFKQHARFHSTLALSSLLCTPVHVGFILPATVFAGISFGSNVFATELDLIRLAQLYKDSDNITMIYINGIMLKLTRIEKDVIQVGPIIEGEEP